MNIDELKRKRLDVLKQKEQEINEQVNLQNQILVLENFAKQYLTKEAIVRYGNIKSAYPETALKVISVIMQLVQAGQVKEKIDDNKFKLLLKHLQGPKKDYNIKIK